MILDVTSEFRRGSASARVRKRGCLWNIKDEQTSACVMQPSHCVDCRRVTRAPTLWHGFSHKPSVSVRARAQRCVFLWASVLVPSSGVRARGSVTVFASTQPWQGKPRISARCSMNKLWWVHSQVSTKVRERFSLRVRGISVYLFVFVCLSSLWRARYLCCRHSLRE